MEIIYSKSCKSNIDEYNNILESFIENVNNMKNISEKYEEICSTVKNTETMLNFYDSEEDEYDFLNIYRTISSIIEVKLVIGKDEILEISGLYDKLLISREKYIIFIFISYIKKVVDIKSPELYDFAISYPHYPNIIIVQDFLTHLDESFIPENYMRVYCDLMDLSKEFKTYIDRYKIDRNNIFNKIEDLLYILNYF